MKIYIRKWFRIYYTKITESIAFYPAIISIGFLLLSYGMLAIDFSDWGRELKVLLNVSLKDASTARTIISTIAGAIISLTVFSFSMVMIVLTQAASQMSNRVLSSMIENRFQQIILGFYIGTTVYALFLLSTIRDISSGIYVPALSIYLLIILTIINIFLFIYFLDYVTQTVKYETVINRVHKQTMNTMNNLFVMIETEEEKVNWEELPCVEIKAPKAGYFQGFNTSKLLNIALKENLYIRFLHKPSTYFLKNKTCIQVYSKNKIKEDVLDNIASTVDYYNGQPINKTPEYGFRQLTEIALKALSPGINDPGTAVLALNSITALLAYKLEYSLPNLKLDKEDVPRIYVPYPKFEEMFKLCLYPIWNYGKKDMYIQRELLGSIKMLKEADTRNKYDELFNSLSAEVQEQYNHSIVLK